jgi:hypothetical protein
MLSIKNFMKYEIIFDNGRPGSTVMAIQKRVGKKEATPPRDRRVRRLFYLDGLFELKKG